MWAGIPALYALAQHCIMEQALLFRALFKGNNNNNNKKKRERERKKKEKEKKEREKKRNTHSEA